jgi:hypothetical protein
MYQVEIKRVEITIFHGLLQDLEFDPRLWKIVEMEWTSRNKKIQH